LKLPERASSRSTAAGHVWQSRSSGVVEMSYQMSTQAQSIEAASYLDNNCRPADAVSHSLIPLPTPATVSNSRFQVIVRRILDVSAAVLFLILAAPLMLVIALAVAIDGGPVFYRHQRVGRDRKPFPCIKFRTMILGADECLHEYLHYHPAAAREWRDAQKLEFDPRVTSVGRFLRSSSLDELPQLFNVVRGDMSLIGPRPVTTAELYHYGQAADLYAAVRPGITGLWQVSGRNDVSYAHRVELDARYVRGRSLRLDLWILIRTPIVVLSRRGAK
jgi:lipopolysaccharide/colanic/teichoic acid biosynthesis glycosyltransferase